jgi:hypothetical protein
MKPIVRLLDAAGLNLDAATRLLADPPNVLAAIISSKATEKIVSAVRLHRRLLNTKDHDLVILIDGLTTRRAPSATCWRSAADRV